MKYKSKIIIMCLILTVFYCGQKNSIHYPETRKSDQVDNYHGVIVADPYRWLEDGKSAETKAWITAQQEVTEKYFSAIGFREALKKRLTDVWDYETCTVPHREGQYYVYKKNNGLQEQSVLYIQEGLTGKPEILLDPNTFSTDGSVLLTDYTFSKDQKYLAYGISRGGSDWREFYVMEVTTRKKLPDLIEWAKFSGLSWYQDGFFYSRYDKPDEAEKLKAKVEFQKIYYHKVGTPQAEDRLIYQDIANPKLGFGATVTESEKFLVIEAWEGSSDLNFIYYKNLATTAPVLPVIDQPLGHFTFVEELDGKIFLLTDCDAPNYRLIVLDPGRPKKENWTEVLPETKERLEGVSLVGGKLVATYLKDDISAVSVYDLSGKKLHDVILPGIGSTGGFNGHLEDKEVFYSFDSYTVPQTIYRYDLEANTSSLFFRPAVKFDPDRFETSEVFYESKDKTRVPLFIVHKKGLAKNGQNPAMLIGYGGFNDLTRPGFITHIIPLLENGGVFAEAALRGGSDYGEAWHQAGMLDKKQNVYDDFIAAAEYLVKTGYTSPGKLAIRGGSNGGLLIGAVINQRPELFKVAIPQVGVMDMLRFHKFTIGWAWVGEFGSSDNPDQFTYLYAYSPLHNIRTGIDYPATLVTTADHDDRVFPAHSFKYMATLQEKYKGDNPVLIRIETKAGHGGASGTSKRIELYADIYAFMFANMGIKPSFSD